MFSTFSRWYSATLHQHKYPVQIVSGGILWLSGDLLSQKIAQKDTIDWSRTLKMTLFGVVVSAPVLTAWYSLLDRYTIKKFGDMHSGGARRLWKVVVFKCVADMLVFDPLYLSSFFIGTNVLEGNSFKFMANKIKSEFAGTWFMDVAVWTPVQLINFRLCPVIYQPLIVQLGNIGWNSYLSYVQHRPLKIN